MLTEYGQIATEMIFGFLALFLMTKFLGKSTISQITTFDFISAIVLGELVGNALYDDKIKLPKILFAVALWGLLIYVMEMITQKFKGARSLLEGQPTIIIHKGVIDRKAMKTNKMDMNQLQHLLRNKNVFSFREVEYAILETDGSINVLKKSAFANPTRDDMNLPDQQVPLPITFISDGEVNWDNLHQAGYDEKWLRGQIQTHGAKDFADVLLAQWEEGGGIHVILEKE